MEKKKWVKLAGFAMIVLLSLFVFTGCDGTVEEENGTGFVRFEKNDASRSLSTDYESDVDAEDLVWAYIAIKKDGLHTVGASEIAESSVTGKTVNVDGKNYVLRPVKEDFGKGLDVEVGPFSWGEWKFVLYAYEKYESDTFTDLIYEGSTPETFSRIDPLSSGAISIPVLFKLAEGDKYPEKGTLLLGDIYLVVPQNMRFLSGKGVSVIFTDTASSPISSFEGTASLTADAMPGTKIALSFTSREINDVSPGTHTVKIEVKYDGTAINTATTSTYSFLISAGVNTLMYGDVTDLTVLDGSEAKASFGVPVCTCDGVEYTSVKEALELDTAANVILLCNVDSVGDVKLKRDRGINTGDYYVKNVTISPDSTGTNISLRRTGGTTGTYVVSGKGAKLVYFLGLEKTSSSWGVWIQMAGGDFSFGTSTDTEAWFSGYVRNLLVNDRNVPVWAHVDGVVEGTLTFNRKLDIGPNAIINKLVVDADSGLSANTEVRARESSVISNLSYINRGINGTEGDPALTTKQKGVYAKITLDGNGLRFKDNKWEAEYFTVRGKRFTLPAASTLIDELSYPLFMGWSMESIGTYPVADGTTLPVNEKEVTVYAAPKVSVFKPVGGRVFAIGYIVPDVSDYVAGYAFYDSSYRGIKNWTEPDDLRNAVYYAVGTPASAGNPIFYVYAQGGWTHNIEWGGFNDNSTYVNSAFGTGTIGGIFNAPDSTGKRTLKVASAFVSGSTSSTNNTMWVYTDYKNGWNNTGYTYGSVKRGDGSVVSDWGTVCPGGCNDWYPCSTNDLMELGMWAGVVYKSKESASFFTAGDMRYSDPSLRPTDDNVKADVWDAFTFCHGIHSSRAANKENAYLWYGDVNTLGHFVPSYDKWHFSPHYKTNEFTCILIRSFY